MCSLWVELASQTGSSPQKLWDMQWKLHLGLDLPSQQAVLTLNLHIKATTSLKVKLTSWGIKNFNIKLVNTKQYQGLFIDMWTLSHWLLRVNHFIKLLHAIYSTCIVNFTKQIRIHWTHYTGIEHGKIQPCWQSEWKRVLRNFAPSSHLKYIEQQKEYRTKSATILVFNLIQGGSTSPKAVPTFCTNSIAITSSLKTIPKPLVLQIQCFEEKQEQ